jgi:hypothetical protein
MTANLTETVLETLTRFGPASADVIARICHVEHVDLIVDTCESMCAQGKIVSNRLEVGILEYRPTPMGEVDIRTYSETTHSRLVIFKEVKSREMINRLRKNHVEQLLSLQNDQMLCVYHILDIVNQDTFPDPCTPMGLTELHSILYGLLLDKSIFICGPLYGYHTTVVINPEY